jgi:hypothetical protein
MTLDFGRFWLPWLLFGFEAGCSTPTRAAATPLLEGRLPAAAQELRARESDFRELSPRAQAHYALYRGLTELGLGNAHAADHWLSFAQRADRKDALCFDASERGQLRAAWRSLGRMAGEVR